jgi:Na+-translocating ferredoxin:NAD+ oxidoreductase RnfG subunit
MKKSTLTLGVVVCVAATLLLLEWHSTTRLRVENQSSSWQLQQMKQLQPETERVSKFVAEADTQPTSSELLRLRSEVTMLRQLTNEIAKQEQNYRWIQESPLARESNNFATPSSG